VPSDSLLTPENQPERTGDFIQAFKSIQWVLLHHGSGMLSETSGIRLLLGDPILESLRLGQSGNSTTGSGTWISGNGRFLLSCVIMV